MDVRPPYFAYDKTQRYIFAMEVVQENPTIRNLKFLGTDLEPALYLGFKEVIPDLKNLLCVKHMADRDQKKLTELKTNFHLFTHSPRFLLKF